METRHLRVLCAFCPELLYRIFLLPKEARPMNSKRDGDLYKVVTIHEVSFELRYGYYEEFERAVGEPIPIYPDFIKSPRYTKDGYPFVTQMQELCKYGESSFTEGCCADCRYFVDGEELLGICICPENRKNPGAEQ